MKKEVLRLQDVTYKKRIHLFSKYDIQYYGGEIMGITPMNSYGMDELLDVIVNNLPLYYGYVYYQERCVNSWKEEKHSRNRICLIDSETFACQWTGCTDKCIHSSYRIWTGNIE